MHIHTLTRPLPLRAQAKDIESDIAFLTIILELFLLLQSIFVKNE